MQPSVADQVPDVMERRRIPMRVWAGAAVVVLLVMAGAVVYRAVTAAPGPLVDYHRKLYQLSISAQPAGPDQWPEFESVLTTVLGVVRGENLFEYHAIRAVGSPLHAEAEKREELGARGRHLMERYRELGVFEHTARLAGIRGATRPPAEGLVMLVLLPHLSDARYIGLIEAARMRLSAERQDWDEFLAALDEGLVLARICAAQAIPIEHMTGADIETKLLQQIPAAIAGGAGLEVLDALLVILDNHEMTPVSVALQGCRFITLDLIQRVYTDDGRGDGRLLISRLADTDLPWQPLPPELAEYSIVNAGAPLFPGRAETVRDASLLYERLLADARAPAFERPAPFDPDSFIQSLPRRQLVLRILTPLGTYHQEMADQSATVRAGIELLIRIERHCRIFGEAPATLEQLAEADPRASTIDPMTGGPFIYRRGSGSRDYVLYAAGRDLRDDGGIWPQEEPPEVALRPGHDGTDYPLRQGSNSEEAK